MTDYTFYRSKLESERARIISDLKEVALYNEHTGDWEAIPDPEELRESDGNNEADGVEEWNERRATVEALEITFNNITRALEKIENQTYGTCEVCKKPIETERLEFLPEARTCTAHMDEEEVLSL